MVSRLRRAHPTDGSPQVCPELPNAHISGHPEGGTMPFEHTRQCDPTVNNDKSLKQSVSFLMNTSFHFSLGQQTAEIIHNTT